MNFSVHRSRGVVARHAGGPCLHRSVVWLMLLIPGVLGAGEACQAEPVSPEYQVKAVFLSNFLRFVDWPEIKTPASDASWVIGIVGENPFGKALDVISRKTVKGRKLTVRWFNREPDLAENGRYPDREQIAKCHVVFIAASESSHLPQLLPYLQVHSVLIVGEMAGFLKSGGAINFVKAETLGRFEIHLGNARRAHLEIQAQLLRLATEVRGV